MLGKMLRDHHLPDLSKKVDRNPNILLNKKPPVIDQRTLKRQLKFERVSALLEKADEEIVKHRTKLREEKPLRGEERKIFEFFSSWAAS